MLRIKSSLAGFSRVTVRESEQGFCVKAVRKPGGCNKTRPVWQSPQGVRLAGQNIRTIADWSSSQNNNNNNAWNQNFGNGNRNNNNKNNENSVRAVRGFTQTHIYPVPGLGYWVF